jgi:hypothetical protein
VSGTAELFLGVIAVSVLLMSLVQVGAIIAGVRLAKRVEQMSRQLELEIKPLMSNLTAVATEAARTAALASRQVERADHLFADLTTRVEESLAVAQQFVKGPARQGLAILSGVQAAYSAFRGMREASRRRRNMRPGVDDEDSLFIG